jgi:hypothetical protein
VSQAEVLGDAGEEEVCEERGDGGAECGGLRVARKVAEAALREVYELVHCGHIALSQPVGDTPILQQRVKKWKDKKVVATANSSSYIQ